MFNVMLSEVWCYCLESFLKGNIFGLFFTDQYSQVSYPNAK